MDDFTYEAVAVESGTRMGADGVAAVCNRLAAKFGAPRSVIVDYGGEKVGASV